MSNFSNGWVNVKNIIPQKITNSIVFASFSNGTTTDGTIVNSQDYGSPSGGTWNSSPLSITAEPTISATNASMTGDQLIRAELMNQQIQMSNLNAPSPLDKIVFVPGNSKSLNYLVTIPLSLGGSSYDNMQISYSGNSVNSGNQHGFTEAFNFDGTFTGSGDLSLIFNGNYGLHSIGIRLESTTNQSSLFQIEFYVIDVSDFGTNREEAVTNALLEPVRIPLEYPFPDEDTPPPPPPKKEKNYPGTGFPSGESKW